MLRRFCRIIPPTFFVSERTAQITTARHFSASAAQLTPMIEGLSDNCWQQSDQRVRHPALSQNLETDVCIVGAGIAGLTTAYRLAAAGKRAASIHLQPRSSLARRQLTQLITSSQVSWRPQASALLSWKAECVEQASQARTLASFWPGTTTNSAPCSTPMATKSPPRLHKAIRLQYQQCMTW